MREFMSNYSVQELCWRGVELMGGLAIATGIYFAAQAHELQTNQTGSAAEIQGYNTGAIQATLGGVVLIMAGGYLRDKDYR